MNLNEQTESALKTLTLREEKIIKLRFGLEDGNEHTLEEVGQTFAAVFRTIALDSSAVSIQLLGAAPHGSLLVHEKTCVLEVTEVTSVVLQEALIALRG